MGQANGRPAQAGYRLKSAADAAGQFHCEIYPHQGGRIGSFRFERADGRGIDALVPMDGEDFDPLLWPKAGIYPLAPWSNLIRKGCFDHGGHHVQLAAHPQVAPHALHGFTQMRVWQAEQPSDHQLIMTYHHKPSATASAGDAWPWAFEVRQTVSLDAKGLHIDMTMTNLSQELMPAGLGFHPYFKLALGDHVRMTTGSQWQSTGDGFVSHKQKFTPQQSAFDITHDAQTVTLHYSDYKGTLEITRADGATIGMTSSPEFCDLVYHVPQGGAYACIEPVTHVVDAFNMHAQGITDTGFHSLQPQETLSGTITITLHTV